METLNKTIQVRYIGKEYIAQVWPSVEGYLDNALKHSAGEYDVQQLKVLLTQGYQHLLIAEDGEMVRGAATIVFENYPNDRIAFVTTIGGKFITTKEVWQQFEGWCKANGCTKVRGFAFESVAKLWKKKFDVDTVYLVVEKKI